MAVNNTLSVKEYALTGGGTNTFPITFEFTTDDNSNAENIHCQLAEKNAAGEYDNSVELTEGVAGDFQIDGGNVKFIDDASMAGKFLVIYRSTPVTQLTDFIDNGNYSLEDIERALDKLTFILQERTGTPAGTYINVGVSLFFAYILQLTNKTDFLNNIFTWDDVDPDDKPGIASKIRYVADLISKSGGTAEDRETIGGFKTFANPPTIGGDPSDSTDAVRKSYADGLYSSGKSYTDNKFPIVASQISSSAVTTAKINGQAVTTAKLDQTSGSQAVTTATMRDSAVTWAKLRKSSASVTLTYDSEDHDYYGSWSNGGNKILYGVSGTTAQITQIANGGEIKYMFDHSSNSSITVYYLY